MSKGRNSHRPTCMCLSSSPSEPALSERSRYTSAGSQLPWTPTVFPPLCTFGAPCPGSSQPASPHLVTSFSPPPAGVADSLPGFHHEADTVWNFSFCMDGLSSWVAVGGREDKDGRTFLSLVCFHDAPAWCYRILWSSFITWHSAIEHSGPLRGEALRFPKDKPEADWYLTLPKPHMYNNYDTV